MVLSFSRPYFMKIQENHFQVVLTIFVYFTIRMSLFYNCLDLVKEKAVRYYRYYLFELLKNYIAYSLSSFLSRDRSSMDLVYFYLQPRNYWLLLTILIMSYLTAHSEAKPFIFSRFKHHTIAKLPIFRICIVYWRW